MHTIETIIRIVLFLAFILYSVYIWTFVFRSWSFMLPEKAGLAAINLAREIRPFVMVAIPIDTIHDLANDSSPLSKIISLLLHMFYMWLVIFDKDDRWKKRRKKVAAKVKEVGGKLVIVPEPVPVTAGV